MDELILSCETIFFSSQKRWNLLEIKTSSKKNMLAKIRHTGEPNLSYSLGPIIFSSMTISY